MQNTDPLLELIHSLNPNEKRYFKLHASVYSGGKFKSIYESLFNALTKSPLSDYNEALFLKQNKDKPFIKNLPERKSHLKNLILKVMRNYQANEDIFMQLHTAALDYFFLRKRGLTSQARQVVSRTLKIAREMEVDEHALIFNKYAMGFSITNQAESLDWQEYEKQDMLLLNRISNSRKAYALHDSFHMHTLQKDSPKKTKALTNLAAKAEILSNTSGISFETQKTLGNLLSNLYCSQKQYNKAFSLMQTLFDKMDTAPNSEVLYTFNIRSVSSSYLWSAQEAGRWDVFPSKLALLQKQKTTKDFSLGLLDAFIYNYYGLQYVLHKGEPDKILPALKACYAATKDYLPAMDLPRKLLLLTAMARAEFYCKKYDKALAHLQQLHLLMGRDFEDAAFVLQARITEWFCHLAMGNYAILNNATRSIERYASTQNIKTAFIIKLIALLKLIQTQKYVISDTVIKAIDLIPAADNLKDTELKNLIHHYFHSKK